MSALKPIPPNPPRWEPSDDPASIVVPGLDLSASVHDQVDQIEQLITLRLQNIDANFSKIQHLMSTKLLPAVKRYAVGTEPVREAAKFWTSFYEETAQIRIPTYEDYSSIHDQPSQSEQEEETGSTIESGPVTATPPMHDSSIASTESSFMPGQAAYSSTPATGARHRAFDVHDSFSSQNSDENPSWTASIESPLVRLDREIQNLTREDSEPVGLPFASTAPSATRPSVEEDRTIRSHIDKGKAREQPESLLRNVLRQNLQPGDESSTSSILPTPRARPRHRVSPLKVQAKLKTPIPNSLNPYLPSNSNPADWSGIVDLSDPSILTPQRQRYERTYKTQPSSHRKLPSRSTTPTAPAPHYDDSLDDSAMDLPPGMSPPVTMQFARPPRSSVGLGLLPKLGKTPKKEAVDRIRQDIIGDIEKRGVKGPLFNRGYGGPAGGVDTSRDRRGVESSMSTAPSPPSLSRYTRHAYPYGMDSNSSVGLDPSLESMMRRVGLNVPQSGDRADFMSGNASDSRSREPAVGSSLLVPPQHVSQELKTPDQLQNIPRSQADETISAKALSPESDSDSDSLNDEPHNTAHPSAAFLMASQHQRGSDDSFGSSNNSSDSLGDEQGGEDEDIAPVHPFARGFSQDDGEGDGFDDSFEDEAYERQGGEEETLFGVPPARRLHAQGPATRSEQELRLLGEDLLQDTIGIGAQMAQTGRVEESPTPWVGGARSRA